MEQDEQLRTASDILLALEQNVKHLMQMHRSLDLNLKVLSNKINQVISVIMLPNEETNPFSFDENNPATIALAPPSFQGEGFKMNIQDELSIPKDTGMPVDTSPVGFRRTSRPETYSNPEREKKNIPTPSIPQPQMFQSKVMESSTQHISNSDNKIPVIQRVVDRNSKSIFMAEVEVTNAQTNIVEIKTRTSGVGKWQATLAPGTYKVSVRKRESLSKQNLEIVQNITIDSNTPNELPMLIVK